MHSISIQFLSHPSYPLIDNILLQVSVLYMVLDLKISEKCSLTKDFPSNISGHYVNIMSLSVAGRLGNTISITQCSKNNAILWNITINQMIIISLLLIICLY